MQPVDANEDLILQLSGKSRLNHVGGMVAAFSTAQPVFSPPTSAAP
jgi:hypothetical protein